MSDRQYVIAFYVSVPENATVDDNRALVDGVSAAIDTFLATHPGYGARTNSVALVEDKDMAWDIIRDRA